MVTITFPARDTEKRALVFLLGRFSGQVLRSGERLVPEAALERLANQGIPLAAMGKAYVQLLMDRQKLLMQLQGHAACDDPEIRDVVRRNFGEIVEYVERVSGMPE